MHFVIAIAPHVAYTPGDGGTHLRRSGHVDHHRSRYVRSAGNAADSD